MTQCQRSYEHCPGTCKLTICPFSWSFLWFFVTRSCKKSQNYKFPPIENTSKALENDAWYAETYLQWFLQSNFEKIRKLNFFDFSAGEASQLDDFVRARHPTKIEPQKLSLCMHISINLCWKLHLSLFWDSTRKPLTVTILWRKKTEFHWTLPVPIWPYHGRWRRVLRTI